MASIKKMKTRVAKFLRKECGISWADAFKCANMMKDGGSYPFDFLIDQGYPVNIKSCYSEYDEYIYGDGYSYEYSINGYSLGNLDYMYSTYIKASTWADNPRS